MSEVPRSEDELIQELTPGQRQKIEGLRDKLEPLQEKHQELVKIIMSPDDFTQEQYDELLVLQKEIEEIAAKIIEIKKQEEQ